jgi:hypothetical protein
MNIVTQNGVIIECKDELVTYVFEDDNDLNNFLRRLATSQVKTSGIRILNVVGENVKMNEGRKMALQLMESLDGIGGERHDEICDETINKLNELINKAK